MITHGLTRRGKKHPLYPRWTQMRARCQNPNCDRYRFYGGRGIKLCDRWQTFINFFNDMEPSFYTGATLERKDNNGPYSPENCIWVGKLEQANNKRNNHFLTFNGETRSIRAWARFLGISNGTIHNRLKNGRTVEEALFQCRLSRRWQKQP